MEPLKSDIVPTVDATTQNNWRSSIRSYYTQNGFSDVSDEEVINTFTEASGYTVTPKEITLFLQGSSIESIISARSTGRTPDALMPFRSNEETQNEVIKSGAQASGCISLFAALVTFGLLAYLMHFFFFSDTAKFMDSLK